MHRLLPDVYSLLQAWYFPAVRKGNTEISVSLTDGTGHALHTRRKVFFMHFRFSFFSVLLLFLLLGGCAAKNTANRPAARFPEQPAATLAKGPDFCLVEARNHKAYRVGGGWGFKRENAFQIAVAPGHRQPYYNTVPLENLLVRTRNEVEFTQTPANGERYVVVDSGTISRTITTKEGRMYAIWRGQMHLLPEKTSPALFEQAAKRPLPRRATPETLALARAVPREYWFDITEPFSLGGKAAGRTTAAGRP